MFTYILGLLTYFLFNNSLEAAYTAMFWFSLFIDVIIGIIILLIFIGVGGALGNSINNKFRFNENSKIITGMFLGLLASPLIIIWLIADCVLLYYIKEHIGSGFSEPVIIAMVAHLILFPIKAMFKKRNSKKES